MNISEEITKLKEERDTHEKMVEISSKRVKEINLTLRKLETQKRKFEAILGEGQKGVAE